MVGRRPLYLVLAPDFAVVVFENDSHFFPRLLLARNPKVNR